MERSELIDALERATGACRELDDAIMAVIYVRDERHIGVREGWEDEDFDDCLPVKSQVWVDPTTDKWVSTHPHDFTASIDAALTLCGGEGGLGSLIAGNFPDGSRGWVARVRSPATADGEGKTPALAICIAALRAREDRHD